MAGPAAQRWALTAALGATVLAAHLLALLWLASAWRAPSILQRLPPPLLTREIRPQTPFLEKKVPRASAIAAFSATKTRASETPPATVPAPPASAALPASAPELAASAPPPDLAGPPPPEPATDTWPADTRLRYRVAGYFRGDFVGDGQVQWQRDGAGYQVKVDVSIAWFAGFSMTSQGRVGANGLLPEAYEEDQRGRNRRSLLLQEGELVFANGQRMLRPPGVQDTASQFVELSHRFATGQTPLVVGQQVQMWLARPNGADLWTYDVVAVETLYPPRLPPVEAFHLKPRPLEKPRGPITAELWFAPSLQYLPVRIRMQVGSDSWVDLLIDSIEQR
jgi:hypothetical protein